MTTVRVTRIGDSLGLILTKEMRERLNVVKGDVLHITDAPGGAYRLTPYDPDFERKMEIVDRIMREDREILRALAK